MAIKLAGEIGLQSDIVAEFGGDAPHNISEYMGEIPKTTDVAWSDFYGLPAAPAVNLTYEDFVTETVGKDGVSYYFVGWVVPGKKPIKFGNGAYDASFTSFDQATDAGGHAWTMPFLNIDEATFDAVPKTWLRTNGEWDYYALDPVDFGYSAISFQGETKILRKATLDMTLANPDAAAPTGLCVRRSRLASGTSWWISLLGDWSHDGDYVDGAEVGMTFRMPWTGGTLELIV